GAALAHARRAVRDLIRELLAQGRRQSLPHVLDLPPHLRLRMLALRGDDEESERGDDAGEDDSGDVRGRGGGGDGDERAETDRARTGRCRGGDGVPRAVG